MRVVNYSDLRKNLKGYLDSVYQDRQPLVVTRRNNEHVVMISIDEYHSLAETEYLLSEEANARHLRDSLAGRPQRWCQAPRAQRRLNALSLELLFTDDGWRDYLFWQQTDRRMLQRINTLIRDTLRSPFQGIGKPEPLRHELQGCWSRRIDSEHRLVYEVHERQLRIIACRYHYQ